MVLGLFAFDVVAVQGSLIQMVNHGISTGALFLIIGMLYERRHTRAMADYGGIAKTVPVLNLLHAVQRVRVGRAPRPERVPWASS